MSENSLFTPARHAAEFVAGVDEAGRGCLAGPVVAGACILPGEYDLPGLNDSKKLTAARRETLYDLIREQAVAWAVGVSWAPEIDRVNILQATFLAMGRAVRSLRRTPRFLRIDGNQRIPAHALRLDVPQEWVIKGDGLVPAISAASILAKTFRDRLMVKLGRRYPGYGLETHMGYGTEAHMAAIRKLGPCPQHRLTFRGVKPEEAAPPRQGSLF
ncbi:ribonuclease HII [Pseudodesulfovibrio sp.]|uniref:ribonuclease HII n=1 Tax=Pseudodesulfovibrio sp. TaxID=2035812 RepID=UPI002615ADDD|nr:ribonuclease HII [Pseudodesulfovibrio sp.]MDD3312912.1 ribonuclease HII [Pseudodesulfovibrio sp.]